MALLVGYPLGTALIAAAALSAALGGRDAVGAAWLLQILGLVLGPPRWCGRPSSAPGAG